jgi:flagellar hook-basal body complex protein FliE
MEPLISSLLSGPEFRVSLDEPGGRSGPAGDPGAGFGGALSSSLAKLDAVHAAADGQAQALATGQATDIASVVTEIERAALAMQLAVQVRNKAVEAYHELFRMQV